LIAREEAIMAAWTKSGTPMKLAFTPSLTESPMRTIEVFPVGGSSCHPRFVENADGIDLYSVDARAGVSVLHRTSIRANATTGETEVVRPLMNLANPPQFEITDAGGESHIAYSAIGSMASSAVGLVSLSPGGRLQPLFSGRGYGWVFVSGASEGERGVFALVKPDGTGREDPRKLVIRQYDGERLGAEMEIVSGQRRAQHVSISHFEDDDFAVVYTAGATAEAAVFRCVD